MSLTANIDIALINTSNLMSIDNNGVNSYYYTFDNMCVGHTATTEIAICNLTPSSILFDTYVDGLEDLDFQLQDLTGLYIPGYSSYTCSWNFVPTISGNHYRHFELYSGGTSIIVNLSGSAHNSVIIPSVSFSGNPCFIDFGTVGVNAHVINSVNFYNITQNNIPISFSGNLQQYTIISPTELSPGNNQINFVFNPQNIGNSSETVIMFGDCEEHSLTLCGNCIMTNSVKLDINDTSSYVGCCSDTTLFIQNNYTNPLNTEITVTNIQYPPNLTTEKSLPFNVQPGECGTVDFYFCPTISGITVGVVGVEYVYVFGGVVFTANSETNITLNAFTHPFTTVDPQCININCANYTGETTLTITNYGLEPFQFYYLFVPDNGYDFFNIFKTFPEPPCVIPPLTTTGITFEFDSEYLTNNTTFNDVFQFKLFDPLCCKELTKCINVSFCPTTVLPNYGYPIHVNCNGENNGQYSFTVNDCSGSYDVFWSSSTIGNLPQYSGQTVATDLVSGNYKLTIINACNEITNHNFTITQPEPLFLSIQYTNPKNYCKSDLSSLCGIVTSPQINPAGYVVIDKETLVTVINNDLHNISGQVKRGLQQYDASENQIANGNQIDGLNSFRNYILDFFSGAFINYKQKIKKDEQLTIKSWDEIVAETIGDGCCFSSFVSGGTAPYIYVWYGPNGYTANSPNIFDRPCCEPYTLVVTDAHGCSISATSICKQCETIIEELSTVNPTCSYSNDGEISVSLSGSCFDEIYKFELESGGWVETHFGTNYEFVGLGVDNYVLRIENVETKCKLESINISLVSKYEFVVSANVTGTTCLQSCDGVVEIITDVIRNEDGVDPVFLYTLDGVGNYSNSNIFTGVCSGNHTITALNTLNYCETTTTINVPNMDLLRVETNVIPASGFNKPDGKIMITVINGVSFCSNSEQYWLENTSLNVDVISNDLIYDEDSVCLLIDDNNCSVEIEDGAQCLNCHGLTEFSDGGYQINGLIPGTYNFKITLGNGCYKTFKVIVGYYQTKKSKQPLFDSKRIDSYGGAKIIGNTPKKQ